MGKGKSSGGERGGWAERGSPFWNWHQEVIEGRMFFLLIKSILLEDGGQQGRSSARLRC